MEETIALIKSCIISKQGGVPIGSLNYEFEKIVGEPIPYARLGFSNLQSLLREVDGLKTTKNIYGEQILTVNDPKIKHIAELIRKQKRNYLRTCSKYYKRFVPYSQTYNNNNYNNKNGQYMKNRNNNIWYDDNRKYCQQRNVNRTFSSLYSDGTRHSKQSSYEEYEENNNVVVIETGISKGETIVYEPIILGHQLIGDDFFLQLAIRNLGLPVWRQTGDMALNCGLCISGQTIQDCIEKLNAIDCISSRIVIMLGAVDIYNGVSCDDLIKDMEWLLKLLEYKFSFSHSAVTICTIPPLANLSLHGHSDKVRALYSFNNWIRGLAHAEDHSFGSNSSYSNSKSYRVIDFFEAFADETYTTQYDWFQLNARMVSGCKHPYVLWNKQGRKRALEMLTSEL
ncbi:hypothetical protein KPH14_003942 [Odynerus spinipes]|uniref:HTH OST-type domain-containing protein n=1 Tax=Odynerus spinipes TaxID=1348599 RepID=A0AAD9RYB1_9HYME|nr:hypothetical protein KPH14_003942 [Odynerus spinipes]